MLYPELLGPDFDRLPRALRLFHAGRHGRARGAVTVKHGTPFTSLLGFPPAREGMPLELEVIADGGGETWIRSFDGLVRRSRQTVRAGLLFETAGPVRTLFRVEADDTGMRFRSTSVRVCGIPVPFRIEATVRGYDDSWEFEVVIDRLGSYRGVMVPSL